MSRAPDDPGVASRVAEHVAGGIEDVQDRLVTLLGCSPEGRVPLVASMLHRSPREATAYWLQLVVSMGIATLGLVVGSTAVIIGAMLVAPLMGPIIGLAMGLATGSPLLVLRSAGRIAVSMVVAIGGAALITLMLPFHELNGELTARASPTVLDLITAAFCAIAGVYATLRPGSDTATAAAGTSISISLVPPLCASGYGVGAAMGSISSGAALLFITNLAAIAVIGTLAFVAAGFGRVDVAALEQAELASDRRLTLANVVTGRMPSLFRSRGGKALRLLLPLAFMAAIYVPLRRALDEVEWQVTARAAVRAALADDELSIVQSRSRVERREVELALVIVGSTADGERARDRITASIQRRAGVTPHLEVYAVPDARAFAGLASTLLNTPPPPPPPAPPPPPPTPAAQLRAAQTVVRASLDELWPSALVGAPLRTEISAEPEAGLTVHVVWLGVALSPDAADSVRRALSARLEREVALRETVIPGAPLDRSAGDAALLAALPDALEASQALPDIAVCVERPPPITRPARGAALDRAFTASMDALLAQHPRVASAPGPAWRVRFVRGACATPTPTPTP